MHVVTHGSGEPLVLIHGIGDTHATWAPVIEPLARSFTVHAVDLPGFGRSPRLPDQGIRALSQAVAAEIGGTFHVAGNSLGGRIGLELAEMGVARSVVAFSPAGFTRGAERRWTRGYLRAYNAMVRATAPVADRGLGNRAVRWLGAAPMFVRGDRARPEDLAARARDHAAATGAFYATLDPASHDDVTREPAGVPITVAWGVFDFLLPYALQARRARAILPNAHHVRLGGAGHIPMFDQPERCVELIVETAARARVPAPATSS